MLKKHSFNHQVNSVVTKHAHALLAGHSCNACQVLLLILLARVQWVLHCKA